MSAQSMLEVTLGEILYALNPLREDLETRIWIIDKLREVVRSIESLKGATVEPFGSYLSQLFSRWGDLDISIEVPNGSHILVPSRKHKEMWLGDVLKALRKTGSFKKLHFVSHARVPILKLESKAWNISCDISINNLSGHWKSKMFLWISLIDHRFRDMVLLVKEWANAKGINKPRSGTFNSYSLSLLVVFHFQTCVPAILPPLEDLYPGNMADQLSGVRSDVEKYIEEIAETNIARFRNKRRANYSSLSQLFISFLGKFLDINTRTTEQGICTYRGQWQNISTNFRWQPRTYAIFIEDPFEQPENTARTVAKAQLTRIVEAFRNTYYLLINPNQSRNTLIPSLVRHEMCFCFPGAAFGMPMADARLFLWSNQYAPCGNHSSSQHQFQKKRQVNQPRNLMEQDDKQLTPERLVGAAVQQLPREKHANRLHNVERRKRTQPKNTKGKNGEHSSPERQVRAVTEQLAVENHESRRQNVERQKGVMVKNMKGQNDKQLSLGRQANKQSPREHHESRCQTVERQKRAQPRHLKGQNGEQLSPGRRVQAANQHFQREKHGTQRPNMERQKRAQPKNLNGENSEQLSLGRQVRAANQHFQREKHGTQRPNMERQKRAQPKNLNGENSEQLSLGRQVGEANQQLRREKHGSRHQNAERKKMAQPKNLKGENGEQLSQGRQVRTSNSQLQRETHESQHQNVERQQRASQEVQIPPVSHEPVGPPWPHTLQPKSSNNVALQRL